jgi:hypothetical protein
MICKLLERNVFLVDVVASTGAEGIEYGFGGTPIAKKIL